MLASLGAVALLGASCSKDDDPDYSDVDPRIGRVFIQGVSSTIVINDVEHLIYNYDSLAYGTDITNLYASFSGYNKTPKIEVFQDGEWVLFTNKTLDSVALDLTNLQIRTTAADGVHMYDYTVALRVHKYDVNAFEWNNIAKLPVEGSVKSFKSVNLNGTYCYFYTNTDSKNYVLSSTDGKTWKSTSLSDAKFNWNTAAACGDKVFVMTDGGFVMIGAGFKEEPAENASSLSAVLFALNGKCWAVGDSAFYTANVADGAFEKAVSLPDGFPTDIIASSVELSGSRTQIGYIYGADADGVYSMWALDVNGNIMQLASSNGGQLPKLTDVAITAIDGEIDIVGGKNENGEYQKSFFSSENAGLNWTNNRHKDLTGNIGRLANVGAFVNADGNLFIVGGESADGVSLNVWEGVLLGNK